MKVVIIIPTYNEADNIAKLIPALQQEFTALHQHDMNILVVDDNSPDNTAEVVRTNFAQDDHIHLITGEKQGLGAAYIRGIKYAMDELAAEIVFEMDADFSHKPEDVPKLLEQIDAGADFVIGSRYVKGGSIPDNWSLLRKLNSRFGNIFARYVTDMFQVKDCTAGFRAIRVSLLRKIDLKSLRVQGYAFQIALLNKAILEGAQIREIPVDFIDRTLGESKLGLSDIMEFFANAWWIRLENSKIFIRLSIVGASGVAVNLGLFVLFMNLGINKFLASPLAIEGSIMWNFLLNHGWTFRWRQSNKATHIKGLKFNVVSFVALSVGYSTFLALSYLFPETNPIIHQLVGIVPATLINYFLNSYWTFKHQPIPD